MNTALALIMGFSNHQNIYENHFQFFSILFLFLISCSTNELNLKQQSYPDAVRFEECTEPRKAPEILNETEVKKYSEYPSHIRKQRIEGDVGLEILVDSTGTILEIRKVSSPHYDLFTTTKRVAEKLQFAPGICGGKKAVMWKEFKMEYKLDI